MNNFVTQNIRNIGIIGRGGEGKTTLTEAMFSMLKQLIALDELKMAQPPLIMIPKK